MMDVLPPKWTELFQHQEERERVDQQQHLNEDTAPHWRSSTHYNTYQACTIHPKPDHRHHLPHSPRKFRTHSYSSNPTVLKESPSVVTKEGETQLRGTRFRLMKATIPISDEDEEQHHQQLTTDHH
jgi:hypothetical protein